MTSVRFSLGIAALLFLSIACQNGKPAAQAEASATPEPAAEETAEQGMVEEAEKPAEDKSQRPSPPMRTELSIDGWDISVDYGAPSVKGRTIWGDLVPYNKIWRTGANEATLLETNKDITINGETLAAGKYALFTIPGETEWTVIFNKEFDQWGAYEYKEQEDALRVQVTPSQSEEITEQMEFKLSQNESATVLEFLWEKLGLSLEVAPAQ